ncbi:hypothetical protein EJ03DRAFT_338057 [Teratosphaeria nubilosa]|uniref:Uncharacterized protein n=1 Tax=Teratosphaeria nubilosa TaxID=161662 RepID=A0A6G1L3B2_9PEZI|nr:hypothetical protein EJ03DRAFT_338057 [Teratosphaeria nubilosa]
MTTKTTSIDVPPEEDCKTNNPAPACWPAITFHDPAFKGTSRACQLSPPFQPNGQAEISKHLEHLLNDTFLGLRIHAGTTGNFFRLEFKDLALRHTFALLRLRSLPYEDDLMKVPFIAHGLAQSFIGRYGPDIWFAPEVSADNETMVCEQGGKDTVWRDQGAQRRLAAELENYFMILLQSPAVAPKDWLVEKVSAAAWACSVHYGSAFGRGAVLDCFASASPTKDTAKSNWSVHDSTDNAAAELTDGMKKMSLDNSRLVDETMSCCSANACDRTANDCEKAATKCSAARS